MKKLNISAKKISKSTDDKRLKSLLKFRDLR